jgi:starch synthase (maltosyl-transferring)
MRLRFARTIRAAPRGLAGLGCAARRSSAPYEAMPRPKPAASSDTLPASPPRITIEAVTPAVDGGKYPVKRLVGDEVTVTAVAFREGHELLAGRLRYRAPGERGWRTAPMRYERDFDRLTGSFIADRVGEWRFAVDAWTDRFGTWQADLRKRVDAHQDVTSDLIEGLALVETAVRGAHGDARAALRELAAALADARAPAPERARRALAPDVHSLVLAHVAPEDLTGTAARGYALNVERERAGVGAWYEMFPRSQGTVPGRHGSFADAARRLPRLAELGFDVIYLPPIHPVGRTHRKGPNNALVAGPEDPGSPWAIGNEHGGHTAVEPALGTLADFEAFVRAARDLGMEVALDYALQCSPDHPWVREHPDWFYVRPDGTIKYAENPPKRYEDIYPLDFWCEDWRSLWRAARDILLFWIARGVRIFRVDNPHTKPFAFWEWVIAEVRGAHPDVVFLAEAFTRPARMKALAKLGFSQSYTYFTWRTTPWELREYFTELTRTEMVEYFRPNLFANTPDILHEYLQKGGRPAFRVRLVLAATLSPLYGMFSGFELCENVPVRPGSEEYLHSEKYEIRVRDWEAEGNITADIALLNRIRRENAALRRFRNLVFLTSENEQILAYHKHAPGNDVLIAVNLDPHHPQETMVHVPLAALGLDEDTPFPVEDLLTGSRYVWRGTRNYVRLDPGERVAHLLRVVRAAEERNQVA